MTPEIDKSWPDRIRAQQIVSERIDSHHLVSSYEWPIVAFVTDPTKECPNINNECHTATITQNFQMPTLLQRKYIYATAQCQLCYSTSVLILAHSGSTVTAQVSRFYFTVERTVTVTAY